MQDYRILGSDYHLLPKNKRRPFEGVKEGGTVPKCAYQGHDNSHNGAHRLRGNSAQQWQQSVERELSRLWIDVERFAML
jgi:hypothetical protein